jgi:hypothetical protein
VILSSKWQAKVICPKMMIMISNWKSPQSESPKLKKEIPMANEHIRLERIRKDEAWRKHQRDQARLDSEGEWWGHQDESKPPSGLRS